MTDLRITQLTSGLTVATERVPGALSVATGVWVGVGSRDEPAEIAGVSHFLEHLLFKGTPRRSSQEIARSIDRVGGDFNAFTTKEYTAYYCRVPAAHAAMAIDVLGDVLTDPSLTDADVDSERQVILEELAMDDEAPDDVAHRALLAEIFLDHPLGREAAGERNTVTATTGDDIRTFFTINYHAGSTVVSVAGPASHEEMLAAVARSFATVRPGEHRPARSAPIRIGSDVVIDDDTEQSHIVIGGRALARTDPRREALDVVNHALGGGLSSRLFDEIRERRGLAYSVYSGVSGYADGGVYQLYAGTQPKHRTQVTDLMLAELASLRADGLTDDELDIAKGYLTGAFALGLEDTGARMARNGASLIAAGSIRPVDEQLARWQAVDHAAANEVIAEVFAATPIVAIVGPGT